MTRIHAIWRSLGGQYAAAWPTVNLYAIPGALIPVGYYQLRIGGPPWLWLGLGAVMYISVVVPFAIARATVLPVRARASRPFIAIACYLAVVACKVVLVAGYSGITGLEHTDYSPLRAWLIPFLNVFILMWFCEAVVTRVATFRARMRELRAHEAGLRKQRSQLAEVSLRDRAELASFARTALEPEITAVLNALRDHGSQAAVPSLQSMVANVVRPLTREVESRAAPVPALPDEGEDGNSNSFWRMTAKTSSLLLATAVSAFAMYSLGAAIIVTAGWNDFFPATPIAIGAIWISLLLAKWLFRGSELTFIPSMVVIILVLLGASTLGSFCYNLFPGGTPYRQTWFTIITVATGLLCAVYQFVGAHLDQLLQHKEAVVTELEQLSQRTRQEMWLNRKRAATNLHGHVQAVLQVAAIQLAKVPELSHREVDEISMNIRHALERIDDDESISLADVEHALHGIADIWDQQAEVTWLIDQNAQRALRTDEQLCRAVVEITTEATLNAIKHGDARFVSIAISAASESMLLITVKNDGAVVDPNNDAGYGTHSFNELCFNWSLNSAEGSTVLNAELVCQ